MDSFHNFSPLVLRFNHSEFGVIFQHKQFFAKQHKFFAAFRKFALELLSRGKSGYFLNSRYLRT